MTTPNYSIRSELSLPLDDALAKVTAALAKEGFGIITKIDLKEKLNEKLSVEIDPYLILGACLPAFAYQAIQAEKEIGLFLPCNVIVYREGAKTVVAAINPLEAMSSIDNEKMTEIAREVTARLRRVIQSLD
ncbi:MAG: DUF302 domain-containing protein [Myxococcales bacterium]|nr:DUF302 domain-containing protein [Myxococcales bacterium]